MLCVPFAACYLLLPINDCTKVQCLPPSDCTYFPHRLHLRTFSFSKVACKFNALNTLKHLAVRHTQVVVYGNSLNMAGIAASLRAATGLEVICLDPGSTADQRRLQEIIPAAIVFDLCDPSGKVDVELLHEPPGTLLIGVNIFSDELMLVSRRPAKARATVDLINIIRQYQSNFEKK